MLKRLEIRNLAVIEHVVFCPSQGLNVISGETGAGKSLLIDAIELIFGQKASKDLIRNDCDSASVEAVFDLEPLTEKRLKPVMDEYGIPIEDGQIIISRIFKEEGKSTARVNGTGVVLSQLRRISSELIDIHGQNDNSRLFDPALHITMLDSYGGKKIDELLSSYRNKLQEYKDLASEYTEVNKLASSSSSRIEYLAYALKEIREADIKPGEDETLLLRKKELSNLARDKALIDDAAEIRRGTVPHGNIAVSRIDEVIIEFPGNGTRTEKIAAQTHEEITR